MHLTTGLSRDRIVELCELIHRHGGDEGRNRPPVLGLFKSVVVTLAYLRRNRVQQELAETYGVSQPTISRAITAITPLLGESLADWVPTAEDLDDHTPYVVDGTVAWMVNTVGVDVADYEPHPVGVVGAAKA